MNSLSDEYSFILNTVKGVLHKTNAELVVPETVNYEGILRIAIRNGIANTIADSINKREDVSENVKREFYKQRMVAFSRQVSADINLQTVFFALDNHEIKSLFLKGTLLKKLYPHAYFRSMSDTDVYAEEKDMDKVYSFMTSMGYKTGTIGKNNHYEYMMGKGLKIEYHPELVAIDSEYGRDVFLAKHPSERDVAEYMNIWEHTIPIDNHEYARQLVPEYHYLYVIMHMMNHFMKGGTGIRSVMDVWVMNNHYSDTWNRELIESLLDDYGLFVFEKYALALADKWFDLEGLVYLPVDVDLSVLDEYECYILESGTYGSSDHLISRELKHNTGTGNKMKYLASRFFLPYGEMKKRYQFLRTAPILLPIMWCKRGFDMLFLRGKKTRGRIKVVMNADQERADRMKDLMRKMVG